MKNIAIIGSTGAIGQALVEHYLNTEQELTLYAFSRSDNPIKDKRVFNFPIDLEDQDSVIQAAAKIPAADLDLVIAATGILHRGGEKPLTPEKSLRHLDADQLKEVFAINTIGPALLMQAFIPLLKKQSQSIFAALSARVGSIDDNHLGGWYSYRASKAALNMLIKTAAIETRRLNKQAIIVGLHPGTVDSRLSRPFQGRVPAEQLFTPQKSAKHLALVMENLGQQHTGKCIAWDGKEISA